MIGWRSRPTSRSEQYRQRQDQGSRCRENATDEKHWRNRLARNRIFTGDMALRDVPLSESLSADLIQLPGTDYRYAERLPNGAVIVVGADGGGAEIAEDLHLAGRRVHLFTAPCRPLLRSNGLAGLGAGGEIDMGALVRGGLRLYGELLAIHGSRFIAGPGLYLGWRDTELDLTEAGVTTVIWSGELDQQLAVAA